MSEQNELTLILPDFEGPLDLLLHLIKELKVDIFDIPITEVIIFALLRHDAGDEIRYRRRLFVDGRDIVLEIKSRMLLPKKEVTFEEEFEEGEDPRESLIQQLRNTSNFRKPPKRLKRWKRSAAYISRSPQRTWRSFNKRFRLPRAKFQPQTLSPHFRKCIRNCKKASCRRPEWSRNNIRWIRR